MGLDAKKLRAYVVWVPMLESDNLEAARLEASLYQDKRISHFWDDDSKLANEFGKKLGLDRKAWDVYILYEKRGKSPSFWMHQLDGVKIAPFLDSIKLRAKAEDLLR
jgi:hypothetical protein